MPNSTGNERVRAPRAYENAIAPDGGKPWRVVPLAFFAAVAMTALMGATMDVVQDVSGDRYAHEVVRDQLAKVEAELPFVSPNRKG